MVVCPECETAIDVEEDELDEGEIVSCDECGTQFEVVSVEPLELAAVSDADEEEEGAAKFTEEDDNGDY